MRCYVDEHMISYWKPRIANGRRRGLLQHIAALSLKWPDRVPLLSKQLCEALTGVDSSLSLTHNAHKAIINDVNTTGPVQVFGWEGHKESLLDEKKAAFTLSASSDFDLAWLISVGEYKELTLSRRKFVCTMRYLRGGLCGAYNYHADCAPR